MSKLQLCFWLTEHWDCRLPSEQVPQNIWTISPLTVVILLIHLQQISRADLLFPYSAECGLCIVFTAFIVLYVDLLAFVSLYIYTLACLHIICSCQVKFLCTCIFGELSDSDSNYKSSKAHHVRAFTMVRKLFYYFNLSTATDGVGFSC